MITKVEKFLSICGCENSVRIIPIVKIRDIRFWMDKSKNDYGMEITRYMVKVWYDGGDYSTFELKDKDAMSKLMDTFTDYYSSSSNIPD